MDMTSLNHLYSYLSSFCPGDFFNLAGLIRDKCAEQHYENVLFNPCTRIILAAAIAIAIDATGLWTGKHHPTTGTHVSPSREIPSIQTTPSAPSSSAMDDETTMELLKGAARVTPSELFGTNVPDSGGTGTSSDPVPDAVDEKIRALNEQLIKLVEANNSN